MHCKKCDAVFHMDSSGKIMLGEPGGGKAPKARRDSSKDEPVDYIGLLFKSKAVRVGAVVALVAVVGYYAIQALPRLGPAPLPTALDDLTLYAGEAVADMDTRSLRKITAPDTWNDFLKWYEERRAKIKFEPPQRPGHDAVVAAIMYKESEGAATDKAHTRADLMLPVDYSDPSKTPIESLELFWVREGETWRIDGKETLAQEAAAAKAKEKAKK
jgi:hypothetical protein